MTPLRVAPGSVVWIVVLSSCTFTLDLDEGALCDGANQCPSCYRCIDGHCAESSGGCGDFVVDGGEVCDDGNNVTEAECPYGTPTCEICAADCRETVTVSGRYCGDGTNDPEESCDDGYNDSCGTCNADCSGAGDSYTCGDGDLCPEFEACDDEYNDECGTCNSSCTAGGTGAGLCGDGDHCPEHEACDDGNNGDPCDGCLA